ncbi:Protein FecR [Achromobacter deleyi]|uniref:Protein FecR n=1 Tax=Achromobacter deleyi TaxID=1353891 RepID=A0A6S7AU98_9BURK|nr:FecR domain-containing protein [Achromobacter deleyi]CAB3735002.1 Protein FecR [Achromobacter deleyi]CAB3817247.1 Protein FecR [Achromobacter deleyi]CAB3858393.1 Protein FecR [Achromobacter deleyi]CAB3870435.1 Protein FecR [Achromobacter deleyi]
MARTDALGRVAGQGPIDPAIVRRASTWMARLWSGEASAADRAACDAWLAAHPDHQRAWTRLQVMEGKLGGVSEPAARQVLLEAHPAVAAGRRKALRVLGLAAVAVGTACALRESGGWYALTADYRSGVGEIREITLADGTRVVLDSHSAIDVRFDGRERRILLREGEILVTTAVDPLARPLRVQSRQGWVQALGTRFTLRDEGRLAQLAVYEGAVDVYPGDATDAALRVHSGQRVRFDARHVEGPMAAREADAAWARGVLVAEDLRVADFTAQLGRYRSGFLRCDPAVADLRVTGVFSLQDTDRALRNLALGLPVDIRYRSPYWVTVSARTAR